MASWFDFLRIEAALALTFIESARVHSSPENSARALGYARKALAQIQHCLQKRGAHGLSEDEVLLLEKRCVEIELALAAHSN
jgi:hypothetical protein